MLGDAPIGNATIDAWEDDQGASCWSARVLMKTGHASADGWLIGSTRKGHALRGWVHVGADLAGPSGGRTVLVELHGLGLLEDRDPLGAGG